MKGPNFTKTQVATIQLSNDSAIRRYKTLHVLRVIALIAISVCSVKVMLSQTIATGTVVGPYCAGSNLNIPYTYTGGTPNAGNTFTAELSDANGSFASPVVIGTFTSQLTAWTVPAVIPATITEGTGYRVRVRSSSPAVTGSANTANITLYELYTGASIFTESVGTGTGNITTYESANNFDNDALIFTGSSGNVSVTNTNSSNNYTGASGGSNIVFTGNAALTISGINTIGYNQMGLGFGVMKNSSSSNGSELTIQVSADGTNWNPLTFAPLQTGGGTNNVWYYRVATGSIPATSNLRIRFNRSGGNNINIDDIELANAVSPATVDLSPDTPQQICNSGGSVTFTATNVANAIYSWTGPGGGSSNVKTATASGSYSVQTSDLFGCSVTRGPVAVTTSSSIAPSVSISSNQGNSICAGTNVTFTATPTYGGSSPSYQWKVNGGNVGSNSPTYTTSSLTNGQIVTVVMTSNLSCASPTTATSSGITMTVTPQPTWYLDADNDNYYVGSGITQCVSPGAGYRSSGLVGGNDCNDSDNTVYQSGSLFIDGDNDGYTNGTATVCYGASVPAGYKLTSLGSDCNDSDNSKWQNGSLFIDADNDGYTNGTATVCYGLTAPAGYKLTSLGSDCDDSDATKWQTIQRYVDADGDGFGTGGLVTVCYGNTVPAGYSTNNTDCAPADNTKWQSSNLYVDADGDGYTVGAAAPVCYGASIPAGYAASSLGSDCNDSDNTKWQSGSLYIDADNDGYTNGTSVVCYGASAPAGYKLTSLGADCNDADATKWQSSNLYVDADGDGYTVGAAAPVCYGASIPAGYTASSLGSDCNDSDNTKWQSNNLYVDADGDGYTVGAAAPVCYGASIPAGYKLTSLGVDCNDSDATKWQSSNLFADADGDGYTSGPAQSVCYGASIPAGYVLVSLGNDCNDNNASVNPAATESCGNGIDDNCNGLIDENCALAPVNDAPGGAIMIANTGNTYPACGILNGNHALATNSPESVGFTGNDVWYRFVAQSSGVTITKNGNATDNVVMLFNSSLNLMPGASVANSNGVGGPEVLIYTNLTAGQTYYISVGTVTAGGGNFTLCVRHLGASFLTEGSGVYSLCSNLKPQWTGANSYTFNIVPTGATPGSPISFTSNGQLPLSTPALGLVYGGTYNVRVDANYNNLTNGNNLPYGPVTIPGISIFNVTIDAHASMSTKETQTVPASVLRGSILSGKPFICSAVNFTVEFTKVSDATGNTAIGMPFEVTTSGSAANLNLSFSGANQITNQSFYRVRWKPNFGYGSGTYGASNVIFVGGAAVEEASVLEANLTMNTKSSVNMIEAAVYPNPSNGNFINLNVTNVKSETVSVKITDTTGRVVFAKNYSVDSTLNTMVSFASPLAVGLYTVEMQSGAEVTIEKMMVTR